MESNIHMILAMETGILITCLSYKLIQPLAGRVPGDHYKEKYVRIRWICSVILRTVTIASAIWMVTLSIQPVVVISAVSIAILVLMIIQQTGHRQKRQAQIKRELPVFLDYLVLQVESGHSIQQALMSASALLVSNGPLHSELRKMENSMRSGLSIVKALEKMQQRLDSDDASAPVTAITQAIQHGIPLGKTLREQSRRIRDNLILQGEEFANTVSVKILIPLLFFIFPASFLVIFSPVIVSISAMLP